MKTLLLTLFLLASPAWAVYLKPDAVQSLAVDTDLDGTSQTLVESDVYNLKNGLVGSGGTPAPTHTHAPAATPQPTPTRVPVVSPIYVTGEGAYALDTVPVAKGGTGKVSWTQYAIPWIGTGGSGNLGEIPIGSPGTWLQVNPLATGYVWGTPTPMPAATPQPTPTRHAIESAQHTDFSTTPNPTPKANGDLLVYSTAANGWTHAPASMVVTPQPTPTPVAMLANTKGGTGQNSSGWTGVVGVVSGTWSALSPTATKQFLGSNNAGTGMTYRTLSGTTNQVILTITDSDVAFSLPQDIHAGATPQLAGLGIGLAPPDNRIESNATVRIVGYGPTPASGAGLEMEYNSGTAYIFGYDRSGSAYRPLVLRGSSIQLNEGNVGIGTAPSYTLDVNGDIHYTGSVVPPSDERLKKNTRQIQNALATVLAVPAYEWEWNDKMKEIYPGVTTKTLSGFLAQDLESVRPVAVDKRDVVYKAKDGKSTETLTDMRGVKELELVPVLWQAIREQQEQINALELRLAKLEKSAPSPK